MNVVFVDSGAWIALGNENDKHHKKVAKWFASNEKHLVTTDYIVAETATWVRYHINHKAACELGDKIFESDLVSVFHCNPEVLKKAWRLFKKYRDQKFSLIDCTSFITMQQSGIRDVLALDHHFNTMGFVAVV